MDFIYNASGKLCHAGWASTGFTRRYPTKFSPRDIAWSRRDAHRGVLEKVAIKRIDVTNGKHTGGQPYYLYVDTYNSHWREDMLATHSEAVSIVTLYYAARVEQATEALRADNSCLP